MSEPFDHLKTIERRIQRIIKYSENQMRQIGQRGSRTDEALFAETVVGIVNRLKRLLRDMKGEEE